MRITNISYPKDLLKCNVCFCRHMLKAKEDRVRRAEEFTVVACHPKEHCVATGTTAGVISLW